MPHPKFLPLLLLTLTCRLVSAADWQPITTELLKAEKAGYGGLCGVVVQPATGDITINVSDRGLYRSTDQGKTWKRLGTAELKGRTETPGCLMIDPIGGQRLVSALVYGSPIIASDNLGESWRVLDKKSGHVDWCAVDWTDPELKFILTLKHESGGLLLKSHDGGKTFEEGGKGWGPAFIFDAKTAVVSKTKSQAHPNGALLRTDDGAKSFQPCGEYHARALPRLKEGKLFWLVDGALVSTADQGKTWKKLSEVKDGICGPVFGADARHLFLLTNAGIRESKDGGATWEPAIALPAAMKGAGSLSWVDYDAKNDILYVMKMTSELYQLRRK